MTNFESRRKGTRTECVGALIEHGHSSVLRAIPHPCLEPKSALVVVAEEYPVPVTVAELQRVRVQLLVVDDSVSECQRNSKLAKIIISRTAKSFGAGGTFGCRVEGLGSRASSSMTFCFNAGYCARSLS
jgi:hypothetical protein